MVTVIRLESGGYRVLVKGAAEIILNLCSTVETADGVAPLTADDRKNIDNDVIMQFAGLALRVLCLAYRDFDTEQSWTDDTPLAKDLTMSCLVGIQVS